LISATVARALLWTLCLGLGAVATVSAQPASSVSRTFSASIERVWTVTESVLQSLGWDVDKRDREVGWLLTDSRGVEFKDFAVYGEGTRHKLRVTLRRADGGATTVSVERQVWREERILWMTERKPLKATDTAVETALLDAIGRSLP
jgi:hypothetical protein